MANETDRKNLFRAYRVGAVTLVMVACILLALLGAWRLTTYSLPMLVEDFAGAVESPSGDGALALYDLGLKYYKEENFGFASATLLRAFNQLVQDQGVVPPERKGLAAQIQLIYGVVNERYNQFSVAVKAYEECLRIEPDNIYAKYNLERLKTRFPEAGKGRLNGPASGFPPDQPGNKKGI